MSLPALVPFLAPDYPGLRDQADWKLVESVPDSLQASPNGAHWAALKRLFSWSIARQAELEHRLAQTETALNLLLAKEADEAPDPGA